MLKLYKEYTTFFWRKTNVYYSTANSIAVVKTEMHAKLLLLTIEHCLYNEYVNDDQNLSWYDVSK